MYSTREEALENNEKFFFTGVPCKYGHVSYRYCANGRCSECARIRTKTIKDKYPANLLWISKNEGKNPESISKKRYFGIDCEKCGLNERFLVNNICVHCARNNMKPLSKEANERKKKLKRLWDIKNSKKIAAYNAAQNKRKKTASPKWLSKSDKNKMMEFYINRPEGYECDHIIPLFGKTVCGLHVYWNMQYLKTVENNRKSNKLLPEYADCTATVASDGTMIEI
jgi:hypothetical protein